MPGALKSAGPTGNDRSTLPARLTPSIKPVLVSTGRSFGYTSAALVEGGAIVSWLEQGGEATRVLARHVSDAGVAGPVLQVAVGSQRNLGYPRTVHAGSETWITWRGADSKLQTARLSK